MNSGLDALPLPVWFAATALLVFVAVKMGERLGARSLTRGKTGGSREIGQETASVLGLLAFMLAFTFGAAASRFDTRRQLVLDEANAIGTAALRARLVANPEGDEIQALLREYVDVRIRAVKNPAELAFGITRSEEIHRELWDRLESLVARDPSPTTSLLAVALNELIDLHAKRIAAAVHNRIPTTVWVALYIVTWLAMTLIGYQTGIAGVKRLLVPVFLILAFSVVILLIADLDRPQKGLLRVGQEALLDLQRVMAEEGSSR